MGKEFQGAFRKKMPKLKISHRFSHSLFKARYIERAARSFKKVLLGKTLTAGRPQRKAEWVGLVKEVTKNLNARFHKSLQMSPDEVAARWPEVHRRLLDAEKKQPTLREMMENEGVREKRDKNTFLRIGDTVLAVKKRARIGEKESDLAFRTRGEDNKNNKKSGKKRRRRGNENKVKTFEIIEILKDRKPYLFKLKDKKTKKVAQRLYYSPELRRVDNI